ncbi:ABC transporter [Ceratobasidium sp. AG-Ba]|nr:ABC transporter [Ceratobasidium sp. AG-Ba]
MLLLDDPNRLQTCLNTPECVIEFVLSTAAPTVVVLLALLYLVGLRVPNIPIFTEFVTQDDIDEVLQKKETPCATEIPSEQTPLLSHSTPTNTTRPKTWRQVVLTLVGLIESAGWTYALIIHGQNAHRMDTFNMAATTACLVSWIYAALRPNLKPSCTPYYDLFTVYSSQFLATSVRIYETAGVGYGDGGAWSTKSVFILDAGLSFLGLVVIFMMPLNVLGKFYNDEDGNAPSLEDQCTLWDWVSFTWVSPLISIGVQRPLEEKDVWQLSQTMQTRVLMKKFCEMKQSSLLRRLAVANAKDLFLDAVLSVVVTFTNYSAPFFLALTLRAIDSKPANPAPEALQMTSPTTSVCSAFLALPNKTTSPRPLQPNDAYLFAFAAFICQLVRSQCELQHLYFARRASVRIRGELIACVYEKALRHKDITGTVQPSDTKGKGKGKESKKAANEMAGADVGKIVSLVSTDSMRVARFVSTVQFVYDTPLSIIIASIMLYNLMGWTAFTGYVAILIALPINDVLVRRTSGLLRGISAIRDKRMRAMNEVILGIKFIKYSAWETRWMNRILAAREDELRWLKRVKFTNFSMHLVWEVVPVFVSAISFGFYTLVAKKELTVDVAFPCIAVFVMLEKSLAQLPKIANWFLISGVALKRIESYLLEEEVPERISSLKRSPLPPHAPVDSRLGCVDATFRWSGSSSNKSNKDAKRQEPGLFGHLTQYWDSLLVLIRLRKAQKEAKVEAEQSREENPFELRDMNVIFPEGVISLIFGPTGSGKSSLLSALLGEMDRVTGEVYIPKEPTRVNEKTGLQIAISYCAQQPWLQHKSIKDNILFGLPYEKERYNLVLDCCALLPDLGILEDGDETEIGEKGISLSGGQKARVALARAVYARTQVVILDDILSAVDAPTAEYLIQKCLLGPLMKHRTVVLVTHHVDLVLPFVSWVVKLYEGRIEAQGTAQELRDSSALASGTVTRKEPLVQKQEAAANIQETKPEAKKDTAKKLVQDETKSTGNVKLRVYKTYISAASYWLFSILITFLAADQLMQLVQKFWIKREFEIKGVLTLGLNEAHLDWSESYKPKSHPQTLPSWNLPSPSNNVIPYLMIYVGIQGVIIAIRVLNQIPRIMSTLRASRILFRDMLQSVLRSPSRFFDTTPSGHIDDIDAGLQNYIVNVVTQAIALVVAVGTVVYAVPMFIVPALLIAYIHLWFARGYVVAARDLTRISATTRSPIISSFSEVVVGITTVRAFGAERHFLNNMYRRLDRTLASVHYYWMCNRWLLVRFDSLGALSVLIATTGSLMSGASAGLTGIVVVQAQQFVRSLYWGLRYWTELEQSLNSVERVQEYLELPSEPPAIIESNRPPAAWPSTTTGTLVVEDLVIHYAPDLPPVLKGVSFETKPAEKIGIVGRTGSGKSTLALALFRFVDPTSGNITLDNIDILSIGLDDLVTQHFDSLVDMLLIPDFQHAVLFNGTIRDNLDPFNEFTDAELINTLQRVHLISSDSPEPTRSATPSEPSASQEAIQSSTSTLFVTEQATVSATTTVGSGVGKPELTLETKVSDGGNNFSHGQRQLLSLARALLRKSSVIVMDESTASVDFDIDAKVQPYYSFNNRTPPKDRDRQVSLDENRLKANNPTDYDRILMLDGGKVVEYDTPRNLLAKGDGAFHAMCKKSGDYEELFAAANKGVL